MCLVGRIIFGIIFFYLYLLFKEMGDGGEGDHWYFPSGFCFCYFLIIDLYIAKELFNL